MKSETELQSEIKSIQRNGRPSQDIYRILLIVLSRLQQPQLKEPRCRVRIDMAYFKQTKVILHFNNKHGFIYSISQNLTHLDLLDTWIGSEFYLDLHRI